MPGPMQSLWPTDISVDILTPVALMRAQAAPLEKMTQGLIRLEVSTISPKGEDVVHEMSLIAPPLKNLRQEILNATHTKRRVDPARLEAECWHPEEYELESFSWPRADSEPEVIERLAKVLRSREVRSIMESMLTQINEETHLGTVAAPEAMSSPRQKKVAGAPKN